MANEIRNTVRRNPRGGLAIALALSMMALLAWFVLPGIAALGDPVPIPPGSSQQFVTPQVVNVGGTTFGCGTVGSTATAAPIVITNPKNNGVYSAPGKPDYKITLKNVTKTTANWTASGGIQVVDLGVNGGSQTAWYRYRTPRTNYLQAGSTTLANGLSNDFGVTSDNGVHATLQSPGNLYNLSIMTFCYVVPNATVSGYVYRDITGNGSKDESEGAPSSGWAVRAYANGVPIGSATVNEASGAYSLTVPPATDLRLCAVRPTNRWVQVEPSASATSCTGSNELGTGQFVAALPPNGSAASNTSFGVVPASAPISGRVYQDASPYGAYGSGDAGLNGWTVNVYAGTTTSGTPVTTATTALDGAGTGTGDGTYSVSVPNGDPYTICLAPGPGGPWTQTYPPPAVTCTTDGTNGRSIGSLAYPAGSTGNDFAFRHPDATITGTVWKDLDQDGSFVDDPAEEKVSGATVRLYSGSSFVTATTNADGLYTFTTPSLANYTVCFVKPITPLGVTKPASGATCPPAGTATDELSVGYGIANLAVTGSAGNDFGLDYPTVTSVCGQTITVSSPIGNNFVYEVKIDEDSGAKCSASYVMATGPNADPFALLHPVTTGGSAAEVVEKITWTVPAAGQDPVVELVYDDSSPFGNTKTPMILCKVDPRNPGSLFDLLPGVTPADILPAGGTRDGTPGFTTHTSCLISATVSAPPPPAPSPAVRIYTAWVYSSVDGWRSTP